MRLFKGFFKGRIRIRIRTFYADPDPDPTFEKALKSLRKGLYLT